jgi:hypothetical protein
MENKSRETYLTPKVEEIELRTENCMQVYSPLTTIEESGENAEIGW